MFPLRVSFVIPFESNKLILDILISFELNLMLSILLDCDLDGDLITNNTIFLMYLKLDKLIPDPQRLSRCRLEQVV